MTRKILKLTFITFGTIVAIAVIFYLIVYFTTESRINKVYAVTLQELKIPVDSASYQRGAHIAAIRGCFGCHGHDLAGGRAFLEAGSPLGALYAANITKGKGGITFSDQDWVRVLRHGLGQDNKPLWFMPTHDMYQFSNEDLAALISFVSRQVAVDKTNPAKSIKPLGRLLTFFGKYPLLPAEMIDHQAVPRETVPPAATAEYGAYLTTTCRGCHGDHLKGSAPHAPNEPPIPNISSTGHPGKWTDQDIIAVFRTGKTPEGRLLTEYMPWKNLTFNDQELRAVLLYLKSIK